MVFAAGTVTVAVVLHLVVWDPVGGASPVIQARPAPAADATADGPDGPASSASPEAPTAEPIAFARHAASILFDWDTTLDTPESVTTRVLDVADPTGEQTPGLLADLPAYVPDPAWWERLREHATRQRLEIATVEVPGVWTRAVTTGQVRDVPPGTYAVNLTGTRHRTGVVAGEPESSSHPVELTMFVACAPTFDECRLLRLGAPGVVLE